jgi:hypothetical protein
VGLSRDFFLYTFSTRLHRLAEMDVHFCLDAKTNQKDHGWEKFDPMDTASLATSNLLRELAGSFFQGRLGLNPKR